MPQPLGRAYGVFQGNIPLLPGDYLLESAKDGIVAAAGGGQANATPITTQTARVTTVAAAGDSVVLPSSAAGLEIMVINHDINPMQVFGQGSDQINDVAANVGVSQMANSFVLYACAAPGNWYTEGLGTGFQRGTSLTTFSYATIAANAAGTQAAGTAITTMLANVTAAGASYSTTLPVSAPGLEITVHNTSANAVLVFPNAGGTGTEKINALAANAAITMNAGTSTVFTCVASGQWFTVPRVPS